MIYKEGICFVVVVLVFMANVCHSEPQYSFESAAVGRIVGDSPDELISQLNQDDLNLQQATYNYEQTCVAGGDNTKCTIAGQKLDLIKDEFGDGNTDSGQSSWPARTSWTSNELIILEPEESSAPNYLSSNTEITATFDDNKKNPSQLGWKTDMGSSKPLIMFDSPYAGLYVPNKYDMSKSFVGELGQDYALIVPSVANDREFVKVFLCYLALYSTGVDEDWKNKNSLGSAYMMARNSYHWRSSKPLGTVLNSYTYYGLPYLKYSTPSQGDKTWDYCLQYYKFGLSGPINSGGSYIAKREFISGNINITSFGNYSLIEINNSHLTYNLGELVLPESMFTEEFPLKTVVKNITVVGLEDPINLTVENLPLWNDEFSNRSVYNSTCLVHNQSAGISFSHSFTEDSELVFVYVHPVEVVDCENGFFKVYRNITYHIVYEVFSPVFLGVESYPDRVVSGGDVSVLVRVDNLVNESVSGLLFVDEGGVRLFGGNVSVVSGNSSYFNVSFIMPDDEGLHLFSLGFSVGNETKTNTSFVVKTDSLSVSLVSDSFLYESMDLNALVDVVNGLNRSIDSKMEIMLYYLNGSKLVLESRRLNLSVNESVYSYPEIYTPDVGDYFVSLKVSSEVTPGGELVSVPLHVESHGDLCSEQGDLTLSYSGNLNHSYAAYCRNNTIAVSVNLSNTGENNVSAVIDYSSSLIQSIRGLNVYGFDGSPTQTGLGLISFNVSVPVNSSEYGFLEIELNDAPVILSANHSPILSSGYSDVLFSVDWNDSEDDLSALFVCKTNSVNGSGCLNESWCNVSLSYNRPLECDYSVYPVDEGVNEYYAFVCDSFSACSDAFNSSFDVDAHAPNITIISPISGYQFAENTTSVWVNISTDENASCKYNLSDSEFYFESDGANFTETGEQSHSLELYLPGGAYTIYFKCMDVAGNVNDASESLNFSIASSNCSSGGASICGVNYCCGVSDGVCPRDFGGVSCGVVDPDCSVCEFGGALVCGVDYCCGGDDGVCPSVFSGVSCSIYDEDC